MTKPYDDSDIQMAARDQAFNTPLEDIDVSDWKGYTQLPVRLHAA